MGPFSSFSGHRPEVSHPAAPPRRCLWPLRSKRWALVPLLWWLAAPIPTSQAVEPPEGEPESGGPPHSEQAPPEEPAPTDPQPGGEDETTEEAPPSTEEPHRTSAPTEEPEPATPEPTVEPPLADPAPPTAPSKDLTTPSPAEETLPPDPPPTATDEPKAPEPKPTETPKRAPPMVSSVADSRALVEDLLERARRHTLDATWITAHVDVRVSTSAANRWLTALRPLGPLELTLAECTDISTIVDGPGYRRAVLECRPPLSVVIRERDGQPRISGIELTACTSCDERQRFVEDLIAEVRRNGELGERLMPDFELVPLDRSARDTRWESWSLWAEARMRADLSVAAAVGGARVVGMQGEVVRVRYPDDTEDSWRIAETPRGWAVVYDELAGSSPLRVSGLEIKRWRKLSVRQEAAVATWQPVLRPVDGGTGMQVARHVAGATWDAHDDSLLLVIHEREVPFALFALVDIDGRAVLHRWPIPIPDTNDVVLDPDALPAERVAFDPTGQHAAFAAFGHIWTLNRTTDEVKDLGKVGRVTALAWSPVHAAFVWSTPTGALGGLPREQSPSFSLPPAIALHIGPEGNTIATTFGQLVTWRPGDTTPLAVSACPTSATGATRRPDGAWLVACGVEDRRSWTIAWPPGELSEPMGDIGTISPAVSWSHTGRSLVAPAPPEAGSGVVLWDVLRKQPDVVLGRYLAVSAAFSADDSRLAVVDVRGGLTTWEVAAARRRAGVPVWRPRAGPLDATD